MNLKNFGRINRKHVVVVYMAVIGIFVYINWFVGVCSTPRPNPHKTSKSESTTSLSRKILMENVRRTTEKTILFWYKPFGYTFDQTLSSNCGNCQVTSDLNKFNESSAVVFHFNELNVETMPENRFNDQLFVFYTMEAPPALKVRNLHFKEYDGYFNLTMSYRKNADVHSPYVIMTDVLLRIQEKYQNTTDFGISSVLQRKKKLLLMVASNCGTVPGAKERIRISNLLKKTKIGDKFDREGSCFSKERFPAENFKEYKFYLAMENSYHCKDYITEKLYRNGFLEETVPIAWGTKKSDYDVPKNSVIFMEDYDTMDALADYLEYLDKNDTAYLEYFQWRKTDLFNVPTDSLRNQTWLSVPAFKTGLCNLCIAVNENTWREKVKVVRSIYNWVYEHENPECLN